MNKKDIIIIVIVLIVVIGGVYLIFNLKPANQNNNLPGNNSGNEQNQNPSSYEVQGMKIDTLKEGTGPEAKTGNTVTVHYTGTLENGTKFDSSLDRGMPFSLVLGENSVIQGWELGLLGMKVGEKRKLTIPPELGYGNRAVGDLIPANSTLIFEVEMLDIQ